MRLAEYAGANAVLYNPALGASMGRDVRFVVDSKDAPETTEKVASELAK
jgi:hypothetical protein